MRVIAAAKIPSIGIERFAAHVTTQTCVIVSLSGRGYSFAWSERGNMIEYANMVRIPKDLFARLIAAIETPDDLTRQERTELLEDADQWYPYEAEDAHDLRNL